MQNLSIRFLSNKKPIIKDSNYSAIFLLKKLVRFILFLNFLNNLHSKYSIVHTNSLKCRTDSLCVQMSTAPHKDGEFTTVAADCAGPAK